MFDGAPLPAPDRTAPPSRRLSAGRWRIGRGALASLLAHVAVLLCFVTWGGRERPPEPLPPPAFDVEFMEAGSERGPTAPDLAEMPSLDQPSEASPPSPPQPETLAEAPPPAPEPVPVQPEPPAPAEATAPSEPSPPPEPPPPAALAEGRPPPPPAPAPHQAELRPAPAPTPPPVEAADPTAPEAAPEDPPAGLPEPQLAAPERAPTLPEPSPELAAPTPPEEPRRPEPPRPRVPTPPQREAMIRPPPAPRPPLPRTAFPNALDLTQGPTPRLEQAAPPRPAQRQVDLRPGAPRLGDASIEPILQISGARETVDWRNLFRAWLERNKFYPRDAAQLGEQGPVRLRILIEPDGRVRSVDVGSSRVDLQACKLEYSIVSPK